MDLKNYSTIKIKIKTIIGDHDGDCNNSNNEDTIEYFTFYIDTGYCLTNPKKRAVVSKEFCDKTEREFLLESLIEKGYFKPDEWCVLGGESYDCGVSPKGLRHKTRSEIVLVEVISDDSDEIESKIIDDYYIEDRISDILRMNCLDD